MAWLVAGAGSGSHVGGRSAEGDRPMSYYCPLCRKADWHTIIGLEGHIWHMHEESRCCQSHRSRAKSSQVKDCHGQLDMATCAALHAYRVAGIPLVRGKISPHRPTVKNRAEMAFKANETPA